MIADRLVEPGRNAGVAGEMVQRSQRQDAERASASGQMAGGAAQRAVAAARDHRVEAGRRRRVAERLGDAAGLDQPHVGLDALRGERRPDPRLLALLARLEGAARSC